MVTELRRTERVNKSVEMGVFEETAPLRNVMMWGKPGTEAVLGQLLPRRISCFESNFRVLEARSEFSTAVDILQGQGVEILFVKDLLAQKIKEQGIKPTKSMGQLHEELQERGEYFYEKYKDEIAEECKKKNEQPLGLQVLDWIGPILREDKERYGEEVATVMNQMLSLDERDGLQGDERLLPLANAIYARDQSNLLGKTWIWSNMHYPIRRAEVALYKSVLEYHHIIPDDINVVQIQGKGKFEGGDGIAYNGVFYIGCGGRTNMRGIMQAAPTLLSQPDARLIIAYDGARTRHEKGEMDAMHLDTYWMPFAKDKVVACPEETSSRRYAEVTHDGKGGYQVDLNLSQKFNDYLSDQSLEIFDLSKEEQLHYAPNFLNLGNQKVVLSLIEGNELKRKLEDVGYTVYSPNLEQITKGYGGLHCMTAAIKRG